VLEHTETLLEMDLTAIEEIDTAGLQLLLMLQQEAQAQGKQVFFNGVSAAMKNVIDILQLHHRFNGQGDSIPVSALAAQAQ
jgi:anti-sigma B factor antagonist